MKKKIFVIKTKIAQTFEEKGGARVPEGGNKQNSVTLVLLNFKKAAKL